MFKNLSAKFKAEIEKTSGVFLNASKGPVRFTVAGEPVFGRVVFQHEKYTFDRDGEPRMACWVYSWDENRPMVLNASKTAIRAILGLDKELGGTDVHDAVVELALRGKSYSARVVRVLTAEEQERISIAGEGLPELGKVCDWVAEVEQAKRVAGKLPFGETARPAPRPAARPAPAPAPAADPNDEIPF